MKRRIHRSGIRQRREPLHPYLRKLARQATRTSALSGKDPQRTVTLHPDGSSTSEWVGLLGLRYRDLGWR
jgi:hypothetical protein